MFFYGELGFEPEGESDNRSKADALAKEHSIAMGDAPVVVWNENDELLSVFVEGQPFDKRITEN